MGPVAQHSCVLSCRHCIFCFSILSGIHNQVPLVRIRLDVASVAERNETATASPSLCLRPCPHIAQTALICLSGFSLRRSTRTTDDICARVAAERLKSCFLQPPSSVASLPRNFIVLLNSPAHRISFAHPPLLGPVRPTRSRGLRLRLLQGEQLCWTRSFRPPRLGHSII